MILKMKINYYILGIFSLILFSCKNTIPSSVSYLSMDLDSTQLVMLDEIDTINALKYSTVFTDVRYVALESSTESSLGRVSSFNVTNDDDFLLFDDANGEILLFDSLGVFKNRIGARGHGAYEYIHPLIVRYDSFQNHVVVYDGAKKSLLHYGMDGTYLYMTELHKYIRNFCVVGTDLFAIFANHSNILKEGEYDYNIEFLDKSGEIVAQYDPYMYDVMNFRPISDHVFSTYENNSYFKHYYSHLVYKIDGNGLHPYYNIDFGDNQIPETFLIGCKDEVEMESVIRSENRFFCKEFIECDFNILFRVIIGGRSISYVFVDKRNLDSHLSGTSLINDLYGIMCSYFLCAKRDKFYGIIYPDDAEMACTGLINSKLDYIRIHGEDNGLCKLTEDEKNVIGLSQCSNPIIQICRVK